MVNAEVVVANTSFRATSPNAAKAGGVHELTLHVYRTCLVCVWLNDSMFQASSRAWRSLALSCDCEQEPSHGQGRSRWEATGTCSRLVPSSLRRMFYDGVWLTPSKATPSRYVVLRLSIILDTDQFVEKLETEKGLPVLLFLARKGSGLPEAIFPGHGHFLSTRTCSVQKAR